MPIKTLTLGLALLMTSSALAQHGNYVVKHGENDWIIAHRHHLTVPQLHRLNPEIRWASLRPGMHLALSTESHHTTSHAATHSTPHHMAPKVADRASSSTRSYTVGDGENDWIIAHRIGTTTVALRRANPGVNLARLRTGQKIRIPITAVARSVNRIHSRYAVINGDNVNVRRGAGSSSELVATVDSGMRVVVLDRDGEWYRLRFPHGTEGWVRGGLLKAVVAPSEERAERFSRRHAHRESVAVREHVRHAPVAHTTVAHALTPHAPSAPHHTEVASRAGRPQPWIAEDFSDGGDESGKILVAASRFRGVRYRWGSMSRSATDCSGFTSQVFKSEGYKIPRTSREQATSGIPVHSEDLKAGDLVFFHTVRGTRVSHVGIYIGHGRFIHASSAGGHVQVNSLSEGYYNHRLVGARRIAKHKAPVKEAPKQDTPKAAPPADLKPPVQTAPAPPEQPTSLSSIGQ